MKLKYTTKLFIVVNLITVTFRTLQILFLTQGENAFLIDGFWVKTIDIAGTVLIALSLFALFSNSSQAVRQPEKINCKGIPSMIAAIGSGVMLLITGVVSYMTPDMMGRKMLLVLSVLVAIASVVIGVSAITKKPFPKGWALPFIGYWLVELVLSYMYYTEHPLRVRTVYEVLSLVAIILFFVTFGKAVSGVKSEKSFRRIYPLGLTATSLCILSVVPELLAKLFGAGDKTSLSAVMPLSLVSAAIFIGFFTINTFKKSNTIHPKKKKRM
ncbi:MAG: hypothetical protein J6Q76_09180 [Clostridia bacterium]|nr:hypothetical protein [Clostridia bacterium]